jgi:hypothetical protein
VACLFPKCTCVSAGYVHTVRSIVVWTDSNVARCRFSRMPLKHINDRSNVLKKMDLIDSGPIGSSDPFRRWTGALKRAGTKIVSSVYPHMRMNGANISSYFESSPGTRQGAQLPVLVARNAANSFVPDPLLPCSKYPGFAHSVKGVCRGECSTGPVD